jgi:signal transduction histidine kinase
MQQELSAMIIHDMKNSLSLLEMNLEQIVSHDASPEINHAYARCVELKDRLIGFLTLYKSEHGGGLVASPQETNLREFLDYLVETSPSANLLRNRHEIVVYVDTSKIMVSGDVITPHNENFDNHLMEIALESALNNAMRYAASEVSIWYEQDVYGVLFYIKDDGPGVEAENGILHRQVNDSSSSTGIGMLLCKSIIRAHGAGFTALINDPDGGALFSMRLNK